MYFGHMEKRMVHFLRGSWYRLPRGIREYLVNEEERTEQAKEPNEQKLSTRNPSFPLLFLPILMMIRLHSNSKL